MCFVLIKFYKSFDALRKTGLRIRIRVCRNYNIFTRVAEPHLFYVAPAPGKYFDAAPAPTLL
jgi:hypothetical protein